MTGMHGADVSCQEVNIQLLDEENQALIFKALGKYRRPSLHVLPELGSRVGLPSSLLPQGKAKRRRVLTAQLLNAVVHAVCKVEVRLGCGKGFNFSQHESLRHDAGATFSWRV